MEPTGDWAEMTFHDGFAGDSYYEWIGANYYTQPGNGIMTYVIEIHEEGRYELRFHNRHEHSDHTMENDCWVRMDGGTWYKLYSNGSGTVAQWNWNSEVRAQRPPLRRGLGPDGRSTRVRGVRALPRVHDRSVQLLQGRPGGRARREHASVPVEAGRQLLHGGDELDRVRGRPRGGRQHLGRGRGPDLRGATDAGHDRRSCTTVPRRRRSRSGTGRDALADRFAGSTPRWPRAACSSAGSTSSRRGPGISPGTPPSTSRSGTATQRPGAGAFNLSNGLHLNLLP